MKVNPLLRQPADSRSELKINSNSRISCLQGLASQLNKNTDDFRRLCRDPDIIRAAIELLSEHGKKANLAKTEIPTKVISMRRWPPRTVLSISVCNLSIAV